MANKIWKILADVIAVLMIVIAVAALCFEELLGTYFAPLAEAVTIPFALMLIAGAVVVHAMGALPRAIDCAGIRVANEIACQNISDNKKALKDNAILLKVSIDEASSLLGGRLDDIRASVDYMSGYDGSNPTPLTVANNINDKRAKIESLEVPKRVAEASKQTMQDVSTATEKPVENTEKQIKETLENSGDIDTLLESVKNLEEKQ